MNLLKGKCALITGGGRGIGRAVAIDFAKNGANVAIVSRTETELDHTANEIEQQGVKCLAIPADLSSLDGVLNCSKIYFENFDRCDILVNNAGMTHYSTVVEFPLEKAQKLFNLNVIGTYAMIQQILPKMIEKGGGNIIMTASVQGNVYFGSKKVAYCASKAAVAAMGKSLHYEISPLNIQVNVILPGAVQTKMMEDLIKWGQSSGTAVPPESISPIYLFLASDLSRKKYGGKIINQQALFEVISKLKQEIGGKDFEIKEIVILMKEKLNKEQHALLRENQELIDFLFKYRG